MSARIEANGTWTAQVWYRDYSGAKRHKTKRDFSSESEAESWEAEFARDAEGAVDSTFAAFYEVYAADMQPRLREHTWYTKKYMIEGKILPYFGNMRVDELGRWATASVTSYPSTGFEESYGEWYAER